MGCGLLCLILLLGIAFPRTAFAEEGDTVKVAYIDYNRFIEKMPDGSYIGYGAEYLRRIAAYTGWQYEFVEMDWPTAFEAVKNGTVDFYCVARYTPQRETYLNFSLYQVCDEEMNLYTETIFP